MKISKHNLWQLQNWKIPHS